MTYFQILYNASIDIKKRVALFALAFIILVVGALALIPYTIEIEVPDETIEQVIEEAKVIDKILEENPEEKVLQENPDLRQEMEDLESFIEEAEKPLLNGTTTPKKAIVRRNREREMELRRLTTAEAVKNGVEPILAISIAQCESGFVENAQNKTSSAGGIFQFINSTWKTTMIKMGLPTTSPKYDGELNIKAGIWLLAKEGVGHWEASRRCWGHIELVLK